MNAALFSVQINASTDYRGSGWFCNKWGWFSCNTNTDLHTVRLYSSLDGLSLQSFQSRSVVHSVHQLRSCVELFCQVKWLHWGDTVNCSASPVTLELFKATKTRMLTSNIIIYSTSIFTFFLGIYKKCMLVFLFAVCIQKMELPFQPLNFLKANDKHTKITGGQLQRPYLERIHFTVGG